MFDAHRLAAQCFATLLYYTIAIQLHYYTSAPLLHDCHSTTLLAHYYILWLHYDTTSVLHLHCKLTRTRNMLHYYTRATLLDNTATLLPHNTAALLLHTHRNTLRIQYPD